MELKKDYDNITKDVLFDVVQRALKLDDNAANKMIRFAYPHGESQPLEDFQPHENRCYITLNNTALAGVNMRDRTHETVVEGLKTTVNYMDSFEVLYSFYGSKAATYAMQLYGVLFESEAMNMFSKQGIAPVRQAIPPVALGELINGRWISRCDLRVQFYRQIELESITDETIEQVDITVKTDDSKIRDRVIEIRK